VAGDGSPAAIVDVPAGDASVREVLDALDAALAGAPAGTSVRVLIEDRDPRRATLDALCSADPRAALELPGADPGPCEMHVVVPPAARLGPRSLDALRELLAEQSAAAVEVAVPGRLGPLGRTSLAASVPGTARVRAERPGVSGPTLRVGARRAWLGTASSPDAHPPPRGSLAHERAEHLRHRARSATLRARLDRNFQRLTRERMRYQHERARASLLDRRLAEVSTRHRLGRIGRRAIRLALAVPQRLLSLLGTGRSFARRGWRFAVERRRRRRSPGPQGAEE
jgi:hypothetical protein